MTDPKPTPKQKLPEVPKDKIHDDASDGKSETVHPSEAKEIVVMPAVANSTHPNV